MKKNDLILLFGVLLLAAVLALVFFFTGEREPALTADIYVAGALWASVPLDGPIRDIRTPGAGGVNVVRVGDGEAYMLEADCPGQVCVAQGPAGRTGQTIACLPHRVLIVLSGGRGERGEVDVIAG